MSLIKRVMLYAMGAFYVFAGVNHFLDPEFYLPMMPPYLPAHHFLIALSGVAEIACGIGVVIPRTRVLAAWATVALLVAVFPANIHVAVHDIPIGGASEGLGALNFVRLAFQPVLIAWAWWFTRPDPPRAGAQEHASHLAG
jgi:uncharacterized membrane protein